MNGTDPLLTEDEILAEIARDRAEIDREDAPLLMRQLAEDDLIADGHIDPSKGEYLSLGTEANGNLVATIATNVGVAPPATPGA